jgi:hypothetical protein
MRLFLDLLDDRFAEMAVLTDRKFDRIEEWRPQPAAAAT